jgi:hypothetical protein
VAHKKKIPLTRRQIKRISEKYKDDNAILDLIATAHHWKANHDEVVLRKAVTHAIADEYARRLKEAGISREHTIRRDSKINR